MDEIGQKLRSARIEKGYTIDDIQQKTKIQKRYLIAIEEGQFDQLPGDFYIRAFIKQYADVVDLDSDELLASYQNSAPEEQQEITEEVKASEENKARINDDRKSTQVMSNVREYIPQVLVLVVVVVILAVVYGIAVNNKNNNTTEIPDKSSQVSKKDNKKTKTTKKKSTKKHGLQIKSLGNNKYEVSGLKDDSNISVKAGNSMVWTSVSMNSGTNWQGALQSGKTKSLGIDKNASEIVVKTGNTKETTIKIDGKTVKIKNKKNGSMVRTFTFKLKGRKNSTKDTNNTGTTDTNQTQSTTTDNGQASQSTTNGSGQTYSGNTGSYGNYGNSYGNQGSTGGTTQNQGGGSTGTGSDSSTSNPGGGTSTDGGQGGGTTGGGTTDSTN